jgi:hypothetical protein
VPFAGPEVLTLTLFPFAGFVKVIFAAPVNRKTVDPLTVLSTLAKTLSTDGPGRCAHSYGSEGPRLARDPDHALSTTGRTHRPIIRFVHGFVHET